MKNLTIISLILLFACNNNNSKQVESIKTKKVYRDSDASNKLFQQISLNYKKEYYFLLGGLIYDFKKRFKESKHLKRVKFIEKKTAKNRNIISQKRDALYKLSTEKYFNSLNLPELDTIKFENFSFNKHSYKIDFTDIDKKVFKLNVTKQMQVSYLSKQNISKYTTVSVSFFDDCETNIYLYTIDENFKIIDYKLIYSAFPFRQHTDNFKFKNYIINTNKESFSTYFNSDSSFTIIKKEYFTLKDTITNNKHIEIGNEFNATYKINLKGNFIEIYNKSFQKEYIEPLYEVII